MKIIAKGRGKGKTTELVKLSAEQQIPIVCDCSSIGYIMDIAKQMNLTIPHPLTVQDLNMKQYQNSDLLVDNAELILQRKLNCHDIKGITINTDDYNELITEDVNNSYDSIVHALKNEAKELNNKLVVCRERGDMNTYIATLKSLRETLNLIHEYDWQPMYSKYKTSNSDGSDEHYEFATWEQNSDNQIKNHKRYKLESCEDLNAKDRYGISIYHGKKHIMTNDEMDEFEDKFNKEMKSMSDMFRDSMKAFDMMNKMVSQLFDNSIFKMLDK